MKRGQINNAFTILITLLIVGTIALLAVRFIQGIMEDKCTSDMVILENTIQDAIRKGNNYGSVERKRIATACKIQTLCLVDAKAINSDSFFADQQLLEQSVVDGVETNIFSFSTDGTMQDHGYVEQLELQDPIRPLCIRNKGGYFTLQLEGKARTTLVTEVS